MLTVMLQASLFPLPISQPPLPTVSHLGSGSIHPDGGFIFVFVCLLIHASSYSGHRKGFRSTTECKSPRRLIHFHLSLVDIQLLSTLPPVSCSQDISLSFRVWDQACNDLVSLALNTRLYYMHVKCNRSLTSHPPLPSSKQSALSTQFAFLSPADPGATQGLTERVKS